MSEQTDAMKWPAHNNPKKWDDVFKDKHLLKIAKSLGLDWRNLAINLGFDYPRIQGFEACGHSLQDAALQMLITYRNGSKKYGTKAQIDELVEALEETGRMDIVRTIVN